MNNDERRNLGISFAVSSDLAETLRTEAAKRGVSRSKLIFLLLQEKTQGFNNFNVRGYDVKSNGDSTTTTTRST